MPKSRDLNIDRGLANVVGETRRPKLEPETGWYNIGEEWAADEPIEFDFLNSWGNLGTDDDIEHAPASFYLAEDGEVRFRGVITGGSAGTIAFMIPEEVRPQFAQTFICALIGGGKANVRVEPDGTVFVETITS
jgi:hypothetical protein